MYGYDPCEARAQFLAKMRFINLEHILTASASLSAMDQKYDTSDKQLRMAHPSWLHGRILWTTVENILIPSSISFRFVGEAKLDSLCLSRIAPSCWSDKLHLPGLRVIELFRVRRLFIVISDVLKYVAS